MKRFIYSDLLEWKNSKSRKPLIIKGARQVGKTWILKEFGAREYESVAYINCDHNLQIHELFSSGFEMNRILRGLRAISNVDIQPEKTLIIFDEIQEEPTVIHSLKYFCEDASDYHVCAAGSLLGIKLRGENSFPVGKIQELNIYPMNFEEFVLAVEGEQSYKYLHEANFDEVSTLHIKWQDLLHQYYFVGGMPEVVSTYISHTDLSLIREKQKQILSDYEADISKHTTSHLATRIHQVWESIGSQLAKENKRFVYANIKKGARAKEFELALQWLQDAGLVYRITKTKKPQLPLKYYVSDFDFKLYYLDCGLMGALMDAPINQILLDQSIFEEYKGAFTEQFVLQQILSSYNYPIHYYSSDTSRLEVDFIAQVDSTIYAIEVKAKDNLRSKSLRALQLKYPDILAIRLSMAPYREQDNLVNIPLYLSNRCFQK